MFNGDDASKNTLELYTREYRKKVARCMCTSVYGSFFWAIKKHLAQCCRPLFLEDSSGKVIFLFRYKFVFRLENAFKAFHFISCFFSSRSYSQWNLVYISARMTSKILLCLISRLLNVPYIFHFNLLCFIYFSQRVYDERRCADWNERNKSVPYRCGKKAA